MLFVQLMILTVLFSLTATSQVALPAATADSLQVTRLLSESAKKASGNVEEGIGLSQKALAISQQVNNRALLAASYVSLANLFARKNDFAAALDNYRSSQPILRELHEELQLARVLKSCGDIYSARSYFRQAADSYRDAAVLFRRTGQQALLNECQEALGSLTLEFGQPRNALQIYRRSLLVKQSLGDGPGIVRTSSRIAKIYLSLKDYDSSLYFVHEVQRLGRDDAEILTDATIDELIIYSFQGKQVEAADAKTRAEWLVSHQLNPTYRMKLLAALSNYYLAQKDKTLSTRYFDSASVLIQEARSVELAVTGLSMLAEMSYQNGDYPTAYRMMKMMDRYKDIFRTENMERVSAEIKNAAEASLKEREIAYLNKANGLKADKLKKEAQLRLALLRQNLLIDSTLRQQQLLTAAQENQSQLQLRQLEKEKELREGLSRENELKRQLLQDEQKNKAILWTGILVLAVLAGIILWQYRRQLRKNAIIRKQSAELEVLNREIHHRVKNNLQVISSLLDLQSQTLHDDRATAIIKEGIQRVQSMAFIHQNLYQGQAANGVNMHEYILMLSNHLFQTYNIQPDKIKLHTAIEDLHLHTDTAIPLGMILNELISNSLKYAFRGRETGDIQVEMRRAGAALLLRVADNGEGIPGRFDPQASSSFGYEIIKAFCQKLKARLTVVADGGTRVDILVSKFKLIS